MKRTICLVWLAICAAPSFAADVIGQVGYMSGSLMARGADGSSKLLAPKSELHDGMVMTMRPESNLKIEAYQFNKEAPKADNAVFRLLKGGFRTVSGLIGERG